MRRFRDSSVSSGVREWFTDSEFENTMDDLRTQSADDVFSPGQGVDVDVVLLRVYKVNPDFVPLPAGVLGRTTFYPDGRLLVEVCRELAEEAEGSIVGRRRLRSTLAHECGHIALHRHQFLVVDDQRSLFASAPAPTPHILCRGDAIDERVRKRDGREYQANRGMASLLLPARLLRAHLEQVLRTRDCQTLRHAVAAGKRSGCVARGVRHLRRQPGNDALQASGAETPATRGRSVGVWLVKGRTAPLF